MSYAQTITTATASRLVCLLAGDTTPANWAALTNTGFFTLTVDSNLLTDVNPDFTGDVTMADVAASIQTALQLGYAGTICIWSGDHFEIASPSVGNHSNVTVLAAPTGGVDLAAPAWMNGKEGSVEISALMREVRAIAGLTSAGLLTHDSDIKTLIGTPTVDLADDIGDLDGDLATHDSDIKALLAAGEGLLFKAEVTSLVGCGANEFICSSMVGLGAGLFVPAGSDSYRVYVYRDGDGGGAAPQGEIQPLLSYDSATGKFGTSAAFTAAVAVGDSVLIVNPRLMAMDDVYDEVVAVHDHLGGTGFISSTDYLDAGAEQTILEIVPGVSMWEVHGLWLDLSNMTQNGTVRAYLKIDGTNYREIFSQNYVNGTDSVGVHIGFSGVIIDDLKVTYEEAVDEAADRAIPWQYSVKSV